ncbi:hypothetical protein HAX54_045146, partial [Datura stramonium]|nr:hypothetical protein [Datura stramonium]
LFFLVEVGFDFFVGRLNTLSGLHMPSLPLHSDAIAPAKSCRHACRSTAVAGASRLRREARPRRVESKLALTPAQAVGSRATCLDAPR